MAQGTTSSAVVPIGPKLLRRFYEGIVMLKSLNEACQQNDAGVKVEVTDPIPDLHQSSLQAFKFFVYKLAQICDNLQGGTTITSCAVLHHDTVEYVFAANQMTEKQIQVAKRFVTSVLNKVGRAQISRSEERKALYLQVMADVLLFNRNRLKAYIQGFKDQIDACINANSDEDFEDAQPARDELQALHDQASSDYNVDLNSDFPTMTIALIVSIHNLKESSTYALIETRVRAEQEARRGDWSELRHFTGRLLSYHHAVDAIISASRRWPELFEAFEVKYVPSSASIPNPFGKQPRTAHQIIGRMTSEPSKMETLRNQAGVLQPWHLDDRILDHCVSGKFRPIVHMEVLLLDYLENTPGGTVSERFFNGWQYIGSSKPTCQLCSWYFEWYPSSVEVRPCHKNVYINWRVPDVFVHQGKMAPKKREKAMNAVLERVRDKAARVLSERTPAGKRHDSNTDSTVPANMTVATSEASPLIELMAHFGQVSIGPRQGTKPKENIRIHPLREEVRIAHPSGSDDDDDVNDGGASLV